MFKIIFSLVPRINIATIITLQRSFQKIPEKKYLENFTFFLDGGDSSGGEGKGGEGEFF